MSGGSEESTVPAGAGASPDGLLPQVYDELRRLAAHHLRKLPPGQTLQPTAVVHEAYVKLAGEERERWAGRTLFFAAAARAMRDIIVDHVRARRAVKRGGDQQRVEMDDIAVADEPGDVDVLALDEALRKLAQHDQRLSDLVTLRYFAGASLEEAAETLGISLPTANRDWRYAKAWLLGELEPGGRP